MNDVRSPGVSRSMPVSMSYVRDVLKLAPETKAPLFDPMK